MDLSPKWRRAVAWLLVLGSSALLVGAVLLFRDLAVTSFGHKLRPAPKLGRKSADCRSCHEDIYNAWANSHHAHAHRPMDVVADSPAFANVAPLTLNGIEYRIGWDDKKPRFSEQRPGAARQEYTADFVLGYTPLRQYVVPVGNGRYQLSELAFDPARREWFNVFGNEQRQPGEWGHWQGRGMNWNSMCAHCHNTDFSKNYDPATDSYASKWTEQGVGCVQCHDNLGNEHVRPGYRTSPALAKLTADKDRNQQTCAPCHARNELLTGEPRAGMTYHDHFRITLPVEAATFYPDGQVRDEDFNWTSLITSRMGGKSGVTCLDCHEPHTGKTRLPAVTNAVCLQCHGGTNPRNAPVIDPLAHSHHKPDSTGNQCVTCHMPTTTYMQRDPRHDHGFLKPDPLLTKELGIPNACDRCHADKGIDWQIEANDRWYGPKLESRQRQRTRVVDAVQKHAGDAPERLLRMIATEDVPAWKATLLQLARPWAGQTEFTEAATAALADASPLVRSAAVQLLGTVPATAERVRPLLRDPARVVRVDAEWSLLSELAAGSPERRELDAYLAVSADQPVGQLRLGQDLATRGKFAEAAGYLRQATKWDPFSPVFHETLGLVLDQSGDGAGAAVELWRAAELDTANAGAAFQAALAFAGAGKLPDAEKALREAVRRDPRLHRAWYNLGLLLSQTGRAADAVAALEHAESIAPSVADYPYARATIHWSAGQRDAARAAAQRTLEIDPNYGPARQILMGR